MPRSSPRDSNRVRVKRLNIYLKPSQDRVLPRSFIPHNKDRISRIIARVMGMDDDRVHGVLGEVLEEFGDRHHDIKKVLLKSFQKVHKWTLTDTPLSEDQTLLIGAYFTHEYSLESAALFNPSIVPHPDQSGAPRGGIRFMMSLRATGEGHVSSIVFREGMIDKRLGISLKKPSSFVSEPDKIPNPAFEKALFARKLSELGLENVISREVLSGLTDAFTLDELLEAVERCQIRVPPSALSARTTEGIMTLAYSNYEVRFHDAKRTSEQAIFPSTPSQSNGIEDARFVLFTDDDGSRKYYATYTAFNGTIIIPQLLETEDFITFKFVTLNGPAVENKGMALFPRKIGGRYAMLSRQDNENLFLMFSDNIHFWYKPEIITKPTFPWEYVQLGNCGSPIETDAGWLVLSHGVGPMRKYCIGAFLLDISDPTKLLGRLSEPLLTPEEGERKGYVPNVVYTCGAMLHKETLIIPYAMSDYATGFATVPVKDVLAAMR